MMMTNPATAAIIADMSKRQARRMALLLRDCEPGESMQVHFSDCRARIGGDCVVSVLCTCRPIVLRAGATA